MTATPFSSAASLRHPHTTQGRERSAAGGDVPGCMALQVRADAPLSGSDDGGDTSAPAAKDLREARAAGHALSVSVTSPPARGSAHKHTHTPCRSWARPSPGAPTRLLFRPAAQGRPPRSWATRARCPLTARRLRGGKEEEGRRLSWRASSDSACRNWWSLAASLRLPSGLPSCRSWASRWARR